MTSTKIGRNDPCPCGSGLKYKKCHLGKGVPIRREKRYRHFSGVVFDDKAKALSLYDKNITLLEGLIDIFGFGPNTDLRDIKREVSREKVAEVYKLMAWLWPPDTDVSQYLPSPGTNLRSFYMGNMRPETILRSVGRYSLYCDEILVMNPFMNPWFIAPEYNPIMRPEDYVHEAWKWVLFVIQLGPWIYDKQVILLPNPIDFDSKLRLATWESAGKRLEPLKKDLEKWIKEDEALEALAREDHRRSWLSIPADAMRDKFKQEYPKSPDAEIDKMMAHIDKMKEEDPYYVTNPNEHGSFGITTFQSGGNLEQGMYIAQSTGAYLYTDIPFKWREILSVKHETGKESPWSPITYAFQKLDFKFLDKADLKFVHQVKSDGRLESMRSYLRRTWSSIASETTSYETAQSEARDFADELKGEYAKAEIEWKGIDSDLGKWALSRSGVGGVLATGLHDWVIPGLGFALEGVNQLLQVRLKRGEFRTKVPLSVFVDLKARRGK